MFQNMRADYDVIGRIWPGNRLDVEGVRAVEYRSFRAGKPGIIDGRIWAEADEPIIRKPLAIINRIYGSPHDAMTLQRTATHAAGKCPTIAQPPKRPRHEIVISAYITRVYNVISFTENDRTASILERPGLRCDIKLHFNFGAHQTNKNRMTGLLRSMIAQAGVIGKTGFSLLGL